MIRGLCFDSPCTMNKNAGKFVLAGVVYAGFAVYLCQPYFKDFDRFGFLLVINACLGSLGCYVLSRRWVGSFAGSFFGGAIYGFGPFALGLAKFHPTAGLLAAAVPWLFCPAAFCFKLKWRWVRVPLSTLPFVVILLFFQIGAYYRLFAIPLQAKLYLADLAGLAAPLVMVKRSLVLVGFYHIPTAAFVMGLSMLLAARRLNIIILFCAGTGLAFCGSFFDVSSVLWLSVPVVCCSVLIGTGMEGLICVGFADRKWVIGILVIMMGLAIAALLLASRYFQTFLGLGADYAKLFVQTAKMYILGSVTAAIIYFLAHAKLRVRCVRMVLLSLAMGIDIFFGARFIVDKIF